MIKIIYLVLFLIPLYLKSQITINQNDMPNVNDTFRLSTTTIFNFNSNETGANYFWDFSSLSFNSQTVDTFSSVLSTPVAYNVVFNNILDPNRATIANKNPNSPSFIQQVQVTESYDFYKESSAAFTKVGFGAKINDVPTPIKYDVPEKYYKFPLTFGTTDSSISKFGIDVPTFGHFGQTINRKHLADGWGTISTPFGTFDAIRIKTTINIRDTVFYQNYNFGTAINRPAEYEYVWLAKNKGLPVLKIYVRNMTNSVTYLDSLRNNNPVGIYETNNESRFKIYPTIIENEYKIQSNEIINSISIYNCVGELIESISSINSNNFSNNISRLNYKGIILFVIKTNNKTYTEKAVIK